MSFRNLILYAALIALVLYITRVNNIWGVSRGTKKARADVRIEKANLVKKNRMLKIMDILIWVDNNIGFPIQSYKQKDYKYKLDRLRWKLKALDRPIKPVELAGAFKVFKLLGAFIAVMGFILTGFIGFIFFLLLLFSPSLFSLYASAKIADEDEKLERDFPDFFVVIYSRLLRGTSVRLAPTLKDYLLSLDATVDRGASKKALRNFVFDLRNNIEIYGDDGIAVRKLRDKYTSVTIVNFCNLAGQALNGVDNSDKLLSFKIELVNKYTKQMQEHADMLVRRGSRAVWFVYIILAQFVILSWLAKFSLVGGLSGIF